MQKKTTTERLPDKRSGNDWTYLEVAIFLFYSVTRQLKTRAGSDFEVWHIAFFSIKKTEKEDFDLNKVLCFFRQFKGIFGRVYLCQKLCYCLGYT